MVLSILGIFILLILSNTQYFQGSIIKGTGEYYVKILSVYYQYISIYTILEGSLVAIEGLKIAVVDDVSHRSN